MWTSQVVAGSALVAALALFLSRQLASSAPRLPPVIGTNNTVLFLVNSEDGLSNVFVATAHALLERHPQVHVHFASFPPIAPRLERISRYGRKTTPSARDIVLHQLPSNLSMMHVIASAGKTISDSIHPPGRAGIKKICRDVQLYIAPWSGEDHYTLYRAIGSIVDEVDPALVVLDTFLRPAIDATRDRNRLHAIITPNTLIDNFPMEQPWGAMFWKYPMVGSDIPFPVPWTRIPENIWLNFQIIHSILYMPDVKARHQFLRSKGLVDPINFYNLHRPDVPWFTQTMPEASIPVDVIPPNVTCTGPMSLSLAPAAEQDPDLVEWLARAPTLLINLGSAFVWVESQAAAMAQALAWLLEKTDLQVLWKFRKEGSGISGYKNSSKIQYSDEFAAPLRPFLENGRVKMESWLVADPTSLLETGHVIASVNHGGAGCYHEAIWAGTPQIILPQWLDLYNFAQLVENIGVGTWGCRETSPYWNAECLHDAMLRVVGESETAKTTRGKAKQLGILAHNNYPGQYVTAQEIAKLAASGR